MHQHPIEEHVRKGATITRRNSHRAAALLALVTRRSLGTDLDVLHTRAVPVIGGKVCREHESRLGSVWELSTIIIVMLGRGVHGRLIRPLTCIGAYNTSQHVRVIEPS